MINTPTFHSGIQEIQGSNLGLMQANMIEVVRNFP
jgi:hypothetical protein